MNGIDVAIFQGNIDWQKVKADGIGFAMIKATQGRAVSSSAYLFTDRRFAANIAGAHKAGVPAGVYHYLTAKTVREAQAEADHFIATIAPYRDYITLWAAVDVEEDKYLPRNKKLLTDIVLTFCAAVEAAGYRPMIYANRNYLRTRLNDVSRYPLWYALWRDKRSVPDDYPAMQIWQWGADTVDGISGKVDANIGYFDAAKPSPPAEVQPAALVKGDRVKVITPTIYGTTRRFARWYAWYDVIQVSGDRVVIGRGGKVTAATAAANLKKL